MDWVVASLRVVREVRDWASSRRRRDPSAMQTRSALETASRDLEAYARELGWVPAEPSPVAPGERLVEPLGPAKPLLTDDADPKFDGEAVDSGRRLDLELIDPQAISAVRRLQRYGYKAYLVGGCVRDLLLGIEPKDFDIATDARPEEVKGVFRNSRIIGRRFRLVHLYYRGGKMLEVATFRAAASAEEEEEGADLLIRRDNVFGTEQEDAQRRDFTINALFLDPRDGRIIDYVGGLEDIDARVVRMIGDPDIRLREDPVRIVRAIRFRAKAGLSIEPELEAALARHVEDLARCPPARLLEETLKLLRMGHARAAFDEMLEHGVIDVLLPEVQAFIAGHLSLLAGSEVLDGIDPLAEIRAHLDGLDAMFRRAPLGDDIVLGALLYPMAEAVMAHADAQERDRNKALGELLGLVGVRIQITRKISEQLRQAYAIQRQIAPEPPGRRRRRVSAATMVRRGYFSTALRLYEAHLRAEGEPLDEVESWERRAAELGAGVECPLVEDLPEAEIPREDDDRRRRRRGGRRRRREG